MSRYVVPVCCLIIALIIRAAAPDGAAARSFLPGEVLKGARDIYLSAVYPGVHYALQRRGAANTALPRPIRFGDVGGRGFMVRTWVNGSGPYDFAVDTGAGATIISRRVAAEARVALDGGAINISGLSGRSAASGRKAFVRALSAGDPDNTLPAKGLFIVADGLPHGVDGVLDPTEVFWPLGYVIDIPDGRISAFDPRTNPLRRSEAPANGAVVPWLMDGTSRRPFVLLDGGRRALLDTGSGFGLAVTENSAAAIGIAVDQGRMREGAHDLGGGRIEARRIRPATVHVGSLALRGVPTDLLLGANPNSPVLLGRDALRPFQITFDPVNRLIKLQAP